MYDMVGVWFSLAVVALCIVASFIMPDTRTHDDDEGDYAG